MYEEAGQITSQVTSTTALMIAIVVTLVFLVVTVIAMWKLYEKMGEPGWVSLIPIYSTWVIFEKTMGHGAWMLALCLPLVGWIVSIVALWKFYEGFGKGFFFSLIGLFLSPICMIICAFDSSEWDGI